MSTEIELKYLILGQEIAEKISHLLHHENIAFSYQEKYLANCYYDTANLALRKLDMGLRTRTSDNKTEQTIKTAGVVIGGLHQRPEYNVDIESAFPELGLFPEEIWPDEKEVEWLQSQLIPLFNTNFTRKTWTITFDDAVLELAFDQGEITSKGRDLAISELEVELVSGNKTALFKFAPLLFKTCSLRAGTQSKAARGYRLFSNKEPNKNIDVQLDINEKSSCLAGHFMLGASHCLQQLQKTIEQYLTHKSLTKLADFVDVLALLRQGFWLFDEKLSPLNEAIRSELSHFMQLFAWVDNAIYLQELMNKTGNYRKKLEYSEQLIAQLKLENRRFPDHSMITELLQSERLNLLQLNLLSMVTAENPERYFVDELEEESMQEFSVKKLSENLTLLSQIMNEFSSDVEQCLSSRKQLHRSILTGHWLGCFFDENERNLFRTPWQDMQIGLSELQNLWVIKQQLEKIDAIDVDKARKVLAWQERKVENLLVALGHTKKAALSLAPYWFKH